MDDQALNVGGIIIGLVGGLAIFLYGMEHLTDALKVVAGSRMRNLLARLTTNRFKAVVAGTVVTATIQSSSVTTVLLVGFVSAGLMTLEQSIGVIMGASIGTTITAQIIAFKITHLALIAVAIGFLMHFASKKDLIKQYGLMVLGLGLVFFGMNLMGDATRPLRTYQPFIDLMQSMDRPLVAVLLSASFTALVQSSSATTGVIIVLASQGFLSLEAGIALVLGANIGTCVTALLASLGKPREAVRTAFVHVTFNVAGVVVWFGLIPHLAAWVTLISPSAEGLVGAARAASEVPRQVANAHTTFNLANTLLFIGFTPLFAKWARFLVPERPETAGVGARPRFLDDALLDAPALALDRARLELGRLSDRVVEIIQRAPPAITRASVFELRDLARMDEDIDSLHDSIVSYLGRLSRSEMRPRESELLHDYLEVANHFEAMADIVET
ncbi:MAG: Na/Pi cotransporter family protein, partial [Gemmatimonadota bacterium]|nr:Na/Pi cotransporter family protein [Gemmatimonadota bacterium]